MQFNFNSIFKFATHGSTNFYGIDTCSTMSIFVHVFSFHYSNEIVSRAFLLHSFNNSTKYETDVSAINRLYFYLLLVFKTCLTRLRVITLVAQNNDWAQIKMHWTVQIKYNQYDIVLLIEHL